MKTNIISIIIAILMSTGIASAQTVFYVDGSLSVSGNGTSWAQGFKTVQEGIDAAQASLSNPSSQTAEVWVKQGIYYIYTNSDENTVNMAEGVFIYGGFNGSETQLDQRDWETNVTILDGHQSSGSSNQVKHVVTAFGNEVAADTYESWSNGLLDGFTVTGGNMNAGGGGKASKDMRAMNVLDPSTILSTGHQSAGHGILIFKCGPDISNCIITDNSGLKGGGMYIVTATQFPVTGSEPKPEITNCTFSNNNATMRGGGIAIDVGAEPVFRNCIIENNTCDAKGGGVYIDWVCPEVVFINCLFTGNDAARAGAIGADGSSGPILINCTITGNTAEDVGAGIYTGSYNPDGSGANQPTLINSIVWGNTCDWGGPADLRIWHECYFYTSHSNLGTGFTSYGDGVLYEDPSFVNAGTGDYSLLSGSACVNAGASSDALDVYGYIPTEDINGNPRDANPDMGCYEFSTVNIEEITSREEMNFKVYPNPANNQITIQGLENGDEIKVRLLDVLGSELKAAICIGSMHMDVSDLPSGIYIVEMSGSESIETHKILKE